MSAAADRRRDLIAAARQLIAEKGMAGFTLRAVAQAAGLHHATLLHYFPAKADLLHAVVEDLLQSLAAPLSGAAPVVIAQPQLRAIIAEFFDIRQRLHTDPAMFVVMSELQLHGRHDREVATQLSRLDEAWSRHLAHLLSEGVREGALRADLDVPAATEALMAETKGITMQAAAGGDLLALDRAIDVLAAQLEAYLRPS